MPLSPPKAPPALVTMAAAAAFLVKLALAWNTYGTNDVLFWERNLAKIRADSGIGLYRDGVQIFRGGVLYHIEPFNQPPFMVHALLSLGSLTDRAGVPLGFGLRLASSLADIGSLALIARILPLTSAPYGLLLVAISPVAIMASGFHGNTDAIMIFW